MLCLMRPQSLESAPLAPKAGEGPGGKGGFLSVESALEILFGWGVSEHCENIQRCARPLTLGPSPALGRGEPKSIKFLSDEGYCYYIQ